MWMTNSSPDLLAGSPVGVHQHAGAVDGHVPLRVAAAGRRSSPRRPGWSAAPHPLERLVRCRVLFAHGCIVPPREPRHRRQRSLSRTNDGSSPSSSTVVEPGLRSIEEARLLRLASRPASQHVFDRLLRTKATPSTSATTQSPARHLTPPTRTGTPTEPGLSFVAPVRAMVAENTGNPCASRAATSRTPPSRINPAEAGRLGRGREHLTPVPAVGHLAHVHDQNAAPGRLGHRHMHGQVVARSAADRVGRGGHGGARPSRPNLRSAARPPDSPTVADPSRASAAATSSVCARAHVVVLLGPSAVGAARAFEHRTGPLHQPYTPACPTTC